MTDLASATAAQPVVTARSKGALTKAMIVDQALKIASRQGLEGLTVGHLAEALAMSKSGVFAHFGSREELQLVVVREYYDRFEASVFQPALQEPKGLARLQKMIDLWMQSSIHELSAGCIFISGAVEFDDRPGPVRDELVRSVQIWRAALKRAIEQAVEVGDLKKDCAPEAMLFQIYSYVQGLHHDARFLQISRSVDIATQSIQQTIDQNRSPRA
ncbi:MAG: TetR/AcrR family transcriptional regulator [Alcaligenaceae bacterium]|nr:TetR/AcrR family transcriptional regulator [Alcaligenaceae bacterium]